MAFRILLITPVFYGIENKIKETIENLDYEVTWFENKSIPFDYHGTACKFKFLRRLYFRIFSPQKRYIRNEFKKIGDIRFDYLFLINGFILCSYLFRRLKKMNPEIKSTLYLWDSFSMYSWKQELQFFDAVFTFDRADAERFNIRYKPNFYISNGVDINIAVKNADIFFVGKFNSFRIEILNRIVNQANKAGIRCFVKLWPGYKIFFHHKVVYSFLKSIRLGNFWMKNYLINYEAFEGILKSNFLITGPINYYEAQMHLCSSNVVLDLPFQGQTGYSHRLIEALSKGIKVLTTNSGIKNESFYNSNQIKVFDREILDINLDWLKDRITFPVHGDILKLELSEWLKSILKA
jgi:hypothetical protein